VQIKIARIGGRAGRHPPTVYYVKLQEGDRKNFY